MEAQPLSTADDARDVVIAGAGPVGLALALALARSGVRVLVLEKSADLAPHSRAPAIWPGTQEILARLGVLERFLAEGIVVPRLQLTDADRGGVLLELPVEELGGETACAQLLVLPQSRTERLLLEALRAQTAAEVRFAAEVTDVDAAASGLTVHYLARGAAQQVRARFAVGCDGAHSTLRELIGAPFDGVTYPMQAALADIDLAGGLAYPFPRLTTQPALAIGIRIAERRWRLILPFAPSERRPLETRVADAALALFGSQQYAPVWQSEFHLHRRVAARFADGRIVLAGDAAHLNSPVGGQGMNAGIRDAAELAPALLAALREDSAAPLAAYAARRRRAVAAGVNRFTDVLTRLLLLRGGRMIRPLMGGARLAFRVPALRRRFLRRLAMLPGPAP